MKIILVKLAITLVTVFKDPLMCSYPVVIVHTSGSCVLLKNYVNSDYLVWLLKHNTFFNRAFCLSLIILSQNTPPLTWLIKHSISHQHSVGNYASSLLLFLLRRPSIHHQHHHRINHYHRTSHLSLHIPTKIQHKVSHHQTFNLLLRASTVTQHLSHNPSHILPNISLQKYTLTEQPGRRIICKNNFCPVFTL